MLCVLVACGVSHAGAEGDPPLVTSAEWQPWYEDLLASRLAACPKERGTTYRFSTSGDDDTGDGSLERPFRTIAKARAVLGDAPPIGDVAILFERGGVWRENVGIDTALPNITIADYGDPDAPKPLLTVFVPVGDPGLWEPEPGRTNVYRRPAPDVVTWMKEDDDRDRPYSRQASVAGVEGNEGSWCWIQGVLYVHPRHDGSGGATDPRTDDKAYEVVGPSGAGVVVRGDGSRIENIHAEGWGLREATPSQEHGIESRAHGADRIAIVGCESYYGSSHAMVHAASGAQGGIVTFVECRAGLTRYNGSAGETVFNTYSYQGGQETIFERCVAEHGTLPSSDWDYANRRRARSFFGHTSGTVVPFGLLIIHECTTQDRPFGCEAPASANDLPPAASLRDVRGFIVREVFEGGPGTGPNFAIASKGSVRLNCEYRGLRPPAGSALANYAQDGWMINCRVELDVSAQSGRYSLFNGLPNSPSVVRLWHCFFRVVSPTGGSGVQVLFDYDVPSQASGSSLVNSVLCNESGAGGATLSPNLGSSALSHNAYHRVVPGAFDTDPAPRVLALPALMNEEPACNGELSCGAGLLPDGLELELDARGFAPRRVAIGPFEPHPCGDFNSDWTTDFFDYLDFVAAFEAEEPAADVNADGVVDFFDYLDFVAIFLEAC